MPGPVLTELMHQPWTFRGPREVRDEHGETHFEIRIDEMPDFFVAARTEEGVVRELKSAMIAFFESYTEHGETPPLPQPEGPAWMFGLVVPRKRSTKGTTQVISPDPNYQTGNVGLRETLQDVSA